MPRAAEEIDRYRELIKRAVGFNEERGDQIEVASAPFQNADRRRDAGSARLHGACLRDWSDVLWRVAGIVLFLIVSLTVVRPFLLAMASRARRHRWRVR